MIHAAHAEVFKRKDGKFGWRIVAANGKVMAADGNQGFRDRRDARRAVKDLERSMADAVTLRVKNIT